MSKREKLLVCNPDEELHVFPLFGQEHTYCGLRCWCIPKRDEQNPRVIIHRVLN